MIHTPDRLPLLAVTGVKAIRAGLYVRGFKAAPRVLGVLALRRYNAARHLPPRSQTR